MWRLHLKLKVWRMYAIKKNVFDSISYAAQDILNLEII